MHETISSQISLRQILFRSALSVLLREVPLHESPKKTMIEEHREEVKLSAFEGFLSYTTVR